MKIGKKVLFRASGIGALATDGKGSVLTSNQIKMLSEYDMRYNGEGKKLTENQEKEYFRLLDIQNKPFDLSDTAKAFIRQTWLLNEKGFKKELDNKFIQKGLFGEEIGFSILTELTGRFYKKNTERKIKGNITGECDTMFTENGKKVIEDVKMCWDSATFMESKPSNLYEFQGQSYLHLYDADIFRLRYILADTPEHIVQREKEKIWYKYYDASMTNEEMEELEKAIQPLYDQIEKNLVYSNNKAYTLEERVKTIEFERNDLLFQEKILDRIPYAITYYNSLKLNMIH